MARSVEEHQPVLLENVIKLINSKFEPAQAETVSDFARFFYGSISAEDLNERAASDLYASVLSLWNFLQSSSEEPVLVRVFNPDFESHGWRSSHTVIELVHPDMSFLVDSVRMELHRLGLGIHLHIHLPMAISRSEDGLISSVAIPSDEKTTNVVTPMYLEVDRQTDAEELAKIQQNLERILNDVRVSVSDWEPMKEQLSRVIDNVESTKGAIAQDKLDETLEFLKWISGNHFTMLAYASYDLVERDSHHYLVPNNDSCLGLARLDDWEPREYSLSELPGGARRLILDNGNLLVLTKLSAISTVHRPAHIDYIGIKRLDDKGNVIGEDRFLGLYTSAAYNVNPMSIPVLRQKLQAVLDCSGLANGSHDSKVLRNILETYPRDELFQISIHDLLGTAMGVLHIKERSLIRLFVRRDPYGRFFSCLVYVPREIYNTKLRLKFTDILAETLGAEGEIKFTTTFSESILSRIHFTVPVKNAEDIEYDLQAVEYELQEASRSWEDNLKDALKTEFGEAQGLSLSRQYGEAFPSGYKDETLPQTAVLDVTHMEKLTPKNGLSMLLYRPQEDSDGILKFKLFHREQPTPLSEVLPMLENMGLQVLGETPHRIDLKNRVSRWIMDFSMMHSSGRDLVLEDVKAKFQEAFYKIWAGRAENDGFNRLVLGAGLDWRETSILRAYAKYLWQIGFTFSQSYIEETLARYPDIARNLVKYFSLKFDPAIERDEKAVQEVREQLTEAFDQVSNLDEDKILNRYLTVIDATIRTNFYQLDNDGEIKDYISLKLKPELIPEIPLPVPMFEIFVYSPRVEGVHLRGGKVARGGLRWSDRREDFRTEILGLVKAQQVKNTVIVPVGSKGGFVCKKLPTTGGREAFINEGVACYKIFIQSLLDVTDNYVEGEVVPPTNVVRYDEEDPYLVVAADKGTATFSDIANGISQDYGFWLGDAFASGGSVGYDHKKMGITARGAWESVKRHFMEMNHDTQTTDFTVVGVGDMAGDVFGNGMLLSKHIRLLAAFNHMHIFIDPNPDSATSYVERDRLFKLPGSTWKDYNPELISKGGGVFERSAKSIILSPEMKKMLGVRKSSMSPNELINCLLKAEFDLLWNGGIGTYVKASSERHSEVGDRANDGLRVNGGELRCKVVGEGGNLGLTQLGRIEYMRNGGRCNTDFIDNAGGVNCSDHEVNIKILLNQLVDNGDMTGKQRDQLFLEMTDEVAQVVLDENYLQAQSISVTENRAAYMVKEQMRFIHALEREGRLNRALEFLPSDEEMLERIAQSEGLTRVELAVLLAYGKMELKESLLSKEITDEPYYENELINYFPPQLRTDYVDAIKQHPLRAEIIATVLANEMVDYLGSNFVYRIIDETGATPSDVAICFTLAKEIFAMPELWSEIKALDHKVPAEAQVHMLYQTQRMVRRCTRWFLRHRRKNLAIADGIQYFKEGVSELQDLVSTALEENELKGLEASIDKMEGQGAPRELAARVTYLSTMFSALDIVEMSKMTGMPIQMVAEVYYKLGAELELHWFLDQIVLQPVDNHWQAFARASFREELDWQQRSLTVAVLQLTHQTASADERISAWLEHNQILLDRWRQMVADFRSSSSHEFAKFSVALRELLILVQNCIRAAAVAQEGEMVDTAPEKKKSKKKKAG
ncbi:NAD-glutamate dehydrogenase [Pleionea sp. CnH1-48]|uniref:NAD-glutamate dehydrogenase n=1 Tax=Pleionea sp. CnH1-48 TaxID=2954494 RepID=UPI002097EA65|nr:NAD-glutamate dehydrogenase [Pleionea sp. CnH1-48]MCO7222983.1 NAD-glutamate dehydrogenase [Pleionea sp. CnH1-48]